MGRKKGTALQIAGQGCLGQCMHTAAGFGPMQPAVSSADHKHGSLHIAISMIIGLRQQACPPHPASDGITDDVSLATTHLWLCRVPAQPQQPLPEEPAKAEPLAATIDQMIAGNVELTLPLDHPLITSASPSPSKSCAQMAPTECLLFTRHTRLMLL